MDYNQENIYQMTNGNQQKMPFYMTYPMQNVFLEEMEYERDMERLKRLYPKEVREIQELVEDECDKMEYEGSVMFDETPDRFMLRQICDRIYQRIAQPEDFEAEQYEAMAAEEVQMMNQRRVGGPPPFGSPMPPPHRPPHRQDDGRRNLIEVLLFNEMHNRRCRHRRCRRWW